MKKKYLFSLLSFLFAVHLFGQSTETFETETAGSTTFTDNGKAFTITSQLMGPFDIYYSSTPFGWNGTANDNRFIDNSGNGAVQFMQPVQFTISSISPFFLKSMYLFLADDDTQLTGVGTLTITGKSGGVTVFTASQTNGFVTSYAINNGYTYINMANFGGQNNASVAIDQFIITTNSQFNYVALDAMSWEAAACPGVTVTPVSQTNVSCNGGSNGAATVSASGGSGFTYNWTPGNPAGDGTATATGLTAGTWICTVTNACGNSNSTSFTISQPTALAATQSQTNVSCNGGSNGSATVVASGGTGSYSYSWSPSGGTAATATGLSAGNYTVFITDANSCAIQKAFTITQAPAFTATQSQTNVTCNGGSNGSASVAASGGAGSYSYSWSPSGGTGASASGLVAGNYTVTITDANSCSIQKQFTIAQPAALTATQSQTNVSCNGGSNGSATVVAAGGTGAYTYTWFPSGGSAATATGLSAGNYIVTIADANSCFIQKSFTITHPDAIAATQTQTNVSCHGGSNGTASVSVTGGSGTYNYFWFPSGGNGATASGLSAGNYIVSISDSNNCFIQKGFIITQPANALTATQSQTNISCNGGSNGSATVFAAGGTGTYTYSWSPSGGTGATATGLAAGIYTATITDGNSCSIQKQFTIGNATDCSIATTWDGTSWSNGTPTCNVYAVTISGDYNSGLNGEITACSLTVSSGTVTVASGDNFIIKGAVTVSGGSLTFEQNSNLLQIDNGANSGTITYKRNSSSLYGFDYTIWSSPVYGAQTLKDFSPQTLDERFYVYNTGLNAYSNYLSASGIFGGNPDSETFVLAKGYLIRMPDNLDGEVASVFNGMFTGTPNNGNVSIALNTQGNGFNAVGNPYPSPINVQDFLTLNQPNLDNGTLYFWRKRNGTTGTTYATVTLAAYVAATAEGGDTSGGAFSDGQEANWVINPGQGFLVKAAPAATTLNFTNTMRRVVNNNQFFRTDGSNSLPPVTGATSKLWLNITNETNSFGQAAIAYTNVTTLGLDYGYDGMLINDGAISIYSLAADTKLAIQAREAFTVQDEVPLGYKASADGNYTISLNQTTGVFDDGQDIYLRDDVLAVEHNLSDNGAYVFASAAGTFEDRFNVVYATALNVDNPNFDSNSIIISSINNVIAINSGTGTIMDVRIFDIQGRMIYSRNGINASVTEVNDLTAQEQMLIVQVTTVEGNNVSRKIIYQNK